MFFNWKKLFDTIVETRKTTNEFHPLD